MAAIKELHRLALADATDTIDRLTPAMMPEPSRCAGWTIEDLVRHMVGQNFGFATAIAGGDAALSAYQPRAHELWNSSAEALIAAVDGAPADRVRLIEVRQGPFPLDVVLAMHTLDLAVHVWDAVGDAYQPAAEIVEIVLAQAERIPADRPADAAFGPVIHAEDTDFWHRALALLGRQDQDLTSVLHHP